MQRTEQHKFVYHYSLQLPGVADAGSLTNTEPQCSSQLFQCRGDLRKCILQIRHVYHCTLQLHEHVHVWNAHYSRAGNKSSARGCVACLCGSIHGYGTVHGVSIQRTTFCCKLCPYLHAQAGKVNLCTRSYSHGAVKGFLESKLQTHNQLRFCIPHTA